MTKCTNCYLDYFHRFSSVAAVFVGDAIGQSQAQDKIAAVGLAVANIPVRNQLATVDRTYVEDLGYAIGEIASTTPALITSVVQSIFLGPVLIVATTEPELLTFAVKRYSL
ncbi:hypothetical protein [Tychonema sp. LEGE 06208]|uniref:hypothetical protein n=1 Tax=Tychonema sp. LEGE 06208 TaxID=1828663 RepID=UPI0040403D4A